MKENIKKGDNEYSLDRSSSIYTDSGIETRRERNFDEQIRITIKKKTKKTILTLFCYAMFAFNVGRGVDLRMSYAKHSLGEAEGGQTKSGGALQHVLAEALRGKELAHLDLIVKQ